MYQGYDNISATHPEAEVITCRTSYDIYGNKTKFTALYTETGEIINTDEYTYEEVK